MIFSYLYRMSTDVFHPYVEVSPTQYFTGKNPTIADGSSGIKLKETHTGRSCWLKTIFPSQERTLIFCEI